MADRAGGHAGWFGLIFWAITSAVACSHALPTPPTGPHLHEEPIEVPYPPPAARVDLVQLAPKEMKHPMWLDGQWMWRGRRWVWEAGQWIDLGPNQYYARADGELALGWSVGLVSRKPSFGELVADANPPELGRPERFILRAESERERDSYPERLGSSGQPESVSSGCFGSPFQAL